MQLARGEYTMALDALLKARFWSDAAYVAERVLNLDELKNYVDANWPALADGETDPWSQSAKKEPDANSEDWGDMRDTLTSPRENIRALLGRRLVRSSRGNEAVPYFNAKRQEQLKALLSRLNIGWDEDKDNEERGIAFLEAAKLARAHGLRLMATEMEPDWAIWDGQYDWGGPSIANRTSTNRSTVHPLISKEEIQRATQNHPTPDERFHYRYTASDLAWAAALLLPDGSEDTARALCLGGTWIKVRDPKEADRFYKALVRRCHNTKMGQLADDIRWFPYIDASGNLEPDENQPPPYAVRKQQEDDSINNPSPTEPPMDASPDMNSPSDTPEPAPSAPATAN
jgi:hypothetical protein